MRRLFARPTACFLTVLLLLCFAAPACGESASASVTATVSPSDAGLEPADASASTGDETITEDFDNGYWLYESASQGVRIEIRRYEDADDSILWYEADLQFSANSPLRFLASNEENPGKGFLYPERLARENQAVFAVNDDQFGYREYNRKTVGVIIRNGEILSEKTHKSGNLSWPTLDTAAFFADGTMRVFQSRELTAQEYLDQGASTVLSFGPWLVRDGEINSLLTNHFTTREPRTAIGMISPYHFIVLSVEGRNKYSRGVGMAWLADKMQSLGATEALNLDGGKTACLIFMGKRLEITNPEGLVLSGRSVSGLIALGTSDSVPEYTGLDE